MTLLYVADHKDYLPGLLSRYFDDIVTRSPIESLQDIETTDDICGVVVNVQQSDPLPIVVNIRHCFPEITVVLVLHDEVDVKGCVGIGIEYYLLYPYEEDQIDSLVKRVIKLYEQRMSIGYEHQRDHITSLLNAQMLYSRLNHIRENASILLIDIDNFDLVNTLYGMEVGDKVLAKVAGYLHRMIPENAVLHRLNADEFAVLLAKPVKDQEDILSKQIKSFFELTHFKVGDIDFNLRVSIGIAAGEQSKIFHHAKMALKEAKQGGRNSVVHYRESSPFLKKQRETLYWINEVKSALEEGRVEAYFQPVKCNRSGKVTKYEALCRITVISTGEVLNPQQFLYAALLGGLMTNVTRAMIDKAFKKFSDTDYEFSINVTREDFQEDYILAFLKRKCYLYNIVPSRVFIEIVEDISIDVVDTFVDQIQALSEHGFKLAIDDFGTESSNYSRFLKIDADYLKIDGQFIRDIDQNSNSRIIVESIVDFAKKIGAQTIAEYVNSPSVEKIVKELGVDFSQGFYIGKPQPELVKEDDIG